MTRPHGKRTVIVNIQSSASIAGSTVLLRPIFEFTLPWSTSMPVVWIPALLRSITDGQDRVSASGATLADIIADLDAQYPGMRERLCEGAHLRPGLAAVIDGDVARSGLEE